MAKILVIDDDSHFRGIIERIILRSYAYSVKTVASEDEAWDDLSRNPYDLVMLDLYIDGKKSWDTLKRIKALPSAPVVIMISCEDFPENAVHARTLGAADFVPKPIDFGRLKASVDAALQRKGESRFLRRTGDAALEDKEGEALGLLIFGEREGRAETVRALSSSRFRLFETEDPDFAAETVRTETPDAVLARMDTGVGSAVRLLSSLPEPDPERLRLPVIAITDAAPGRILAAFKAGADDYLTLPVDPRILAAKVEAHVRFRREYRRRLEEARARAVTDALTGLHTPGHFRVRLEEEFHRSLRYKRNLALAILGWNGPGKEEVPASEMGDERVLTELSLLLRKVFRNTDVVGRWGRKEFAVLLPETTSDRILPRVEMIRDHVEERVAALGEGSRKPLCFVGLASLRGGSLAGEEPGTGRSPEKFIGMAHQALYRALMSEGRRVEIFGSDDSGSPPINH